MRVMVRVEYVIILHLRGSKNGAIQNLTMCGTLEYSQFSTLK